MILVTGGTGLLGSHLLYSLSETNQKVKAIFRYENSKQIVMDLFHYYNPNDAEKRWERIDWYKADIREIESLHDCFIGVKQVYHCAGLVSFDRKDFKRCIKTNKEGTQNVVNFCLKYGIEKLCHVSSTAAVGENQNGLTNETHLWRNDRLRSSYSVSKHMAEMEVWRGCEEGLNVVIVNPSIIIGPGDWNQSSSNLFLKVWKGLRYYSKGVNAFVDVRDVSKVMVQLMKSSIKSERFLIIGENLTFQELFNEIANSMGKKLPSIEVKLWMANLIWRIEAIRSFLFGSDPLVTREASKSALNVVKYSNQKIREFLDFEITPIHESIEHTSSIFLRDYSS